MKNHSLSMSVSLRSHKESSLPEPLSNLIPKPWITQARRLARSQGSGLLSTLSQKLGGYPFGSAVNLIMDTDLSPVFFISTLAEHTRNLLSDPRASLTLIEPSEDVQAHARLTLIGQASCMKEDRALRARYLNYFPDAHEYSDMHDFSFWKLNVEHVRFIGGFGSIHWIKAAEYTPPTCELDRMQSAIISHMNKDHHLALVHYCQQIHRVTPSNAEMIGIDEDGFDLLADGKKLRFDFPVPIHTAQAARDVLMSMARDTQC
ncbi:MAG TPA: DUF2470 domain-containing protein [Burkholderiales bacterium]|nr:DUF2470 domain-containing protein [Burkholderiales bacterium]